MEATEQQSNDKRELMPLTCSKKYTELPMAHRQWKHPGHCSQVHGHNWSFEFVFAAVELDTSGFIIDFGALKWLKKWLDDQFDHTLWLMSSDPLLVGNRKFFDDVADVRIREEVTCEYIAAFVHDEIGKLIEVQYEDRGVVLISVQVWEDSRNSAMISGDS